MDIDLTGKIILITGASSGIGYEMAKELLSHGATVIIAARQGPKLNDAHDSLSSMGFDVHAVPMDVRDEQLILGASKWFSRNFDHLDMIVNNVGIGDNAPGMETLDQNHHFFEIPTDTVRAIVETNFIGYFMVVRNFLPFMLNQGSIVYVSTSDETMTREGQLPYGPSKAGSEAMSQIMSKELKDMGIDVNVVCPGGFTDTGMAAKGIKEFFQKKTACQYSSLTC
jgi:gluconate 5-dehydrogenase